MSASPLSISASPSNFLDPKAATAPSGKSSHEAAKDFESLLVGLVMKTARESMGGGGWLGGSEDDPGSAMGELAEQQLASLMSANGGFGLAGMIEKGLNQTQAQVDALHKPKDGDGGPAQPALPGLRMTM
jgi:Rod binding domain-containing protein